MATYSTYKAKDNGPTYPRDASFSSYLDSTERDFVQNLAASVHNQSPARESSLTSRASLGKNRITSRAELGVFGAERYFNEKLDEHKSTTSRKNRSIKKNQEYRREKIDELLEKKSTKSSISTTSSLKSATTQSLKSEGSYTSSQFSGLKILSSLQCTGACFDKKSTYIINTREMVNSPKLHNNNSLNRQEHFAFPIIDTFSYNNYLEDQPRESLEVFGFHDIGKQDIAQNIERELSILAWDAIPNSQNNQNRFQFQFQVPYPGTKKTSSGVKNDYEHEHDHDARSEASSDLFEIENISGIPPSQTSYATSEASIDWSVVTASAADFSVISEYRNDEKMGIKSEFVTNNSSMEKIKVKKSSSSIGGGLLGCKSLKVVNVVGSFNNSDNKKVNDKGKSDYKRSKIISHWSTPSGLQE